MTAPVLTIVIGGNHEASNYMFELHHGGWLAPNIYYLGTAGCVQVNGLRIAGASGIFKGHDFRTGFWEKLPYDHSSMRSIYHVREYSIRTLSLLSSPDVVLSHDWPNTIERFGDTASLLRIKRHFAGDVAQGKLGSPPLMSLLHTLQPSWWFSAHMHVRFEAEVAHGPLAETRADNPDEIQIEDDDEDFQVQVEPAPSAPPSTTLAPLRPLTKFIALDKCIPGRKFLEVVDIEASTDIAGSPKLMFDPEWLAITRAFHPFLSTNRSQPPFPPEDKAREMVAKELEYIKEKLGGDGLRDVNEIQQFVMTAPGPTDEQKKSQKQPPPYTNPQTDAFCELLGIPNKVNQSVANQK